MISGSVPPGSPERRSNFIRRHADRVYFEKYGRPSVSDSSRRLEDRLLAQRLGIPFKGRFTPENPKLVKEILKNVDAVSFTSVVTLKEKTNEGHIISLIRPTWEEIVKIILKTPEEMHKISPQKWEEIIAGSYERAGFDSVVLTPGSGDFGRDVIATKTGIGAIRIIDQVKAFRPDRVVPANDVRALLGVLQADQNATKGVVTTTSRFAPKILSDPFIKPFIPFRLELIDGDKLTKHLGKLLTLNRL